MVKGNLFIDFVYAFEQALYVNCTEDHQTEILNFLKRRQKQKWEKKSTCQHSELLRDALLQQKFQKWSFYFLHVHGQDPAE